VKRVAFTKWAHRKIMAQVLFFIPVGMITVGVTIAGMITVGVTTAGVITAGVIIARVIKVYF